MGELAGKTEYGLDRISTITSKYGINIYPDIPGSSAAFAASLNKRDTLRTLSYPFNNGNPDLTRAGVFFRGLIKPILATGKDAWQPTEDWTIDFCNNLIKPDGVTIAVHYALSKTQSPRRTGSPDGKIGVAELMMLNRLTTLAGTAQDNGLGLGIVIVDETPAIPDDGISGISADDRQANQEIASRYIDETGLSNKVKVVSLIDSVQGPLGDQFDTLYQARYPNILLELNDQLNTGVETPEKKRMLVLLDCLPDKGLIQLGLTGHQIDTIRNSALATADLQTLPPELLTYLMQLTAHLKTIMDLRPIAREAAQMSGDLNRWPQHKPNTMAGGVTRTDKRPAILPTPKWIGQLIMPMHGLAVFETNPDKPPMYKGQGTYAQLKRMAAENQAQLIIDGARPMFALV